MRTDREILSTSVPHGVSKNSRPFQSPSLGIWHKYVLNVSSADEGGKGNR